MTATKQLPLNFGNKYVSVSWAARAIGVSVQTVYRLIEEGKLVSRRLNDRGWHHVSYDSVVKLLQAFEQGDGTL
ncbi:MAG TPA: hypothetical protein VN622_08925 [Clostridia bacterium]|nr:hypothetical protein [Clostridia bacterium]